MAERDDGVPAEAPPDETASGEGAAELGGSDGPMDGATAAVGDALGRFMKVALTRGRREVERAAQGGRVRLEQRQLRKDLDVMYRKLGREVMYLVDGGDIVHPGVVRGVARIQAVEARMQAMAEAGLLDESDDPQD